MPNGCAAHPHVRDVAVVAFPDRRAGTGLYAFVESGASDRELTRISRTKAPEHLQVGRRLATQRRRRGAQRNSAARRHEPGRPHRAAGAQRHGTRAGQPHRFRAAKFARPLRILISGGQTMREAFRAARHIRHCRRHCGTSGGSKGSKLELSIRSSWSPATDTGKSAGMSAAGAPGRAWPRPQAARGHVARNSASASRNPAFAVPGKNVLGVDPVARQHFDRHIELTPGGMKRKGAQQPGDRGGDAGRSSRYSSASRAENLGRQRDQCRGRLDRIGVEIGERRHRIVVEIERARIDRDRQARRPKGL